MVRGYTTVEQSKKLLELGLNPKTADMAWIDKPSVIIEDCPEVPVIMNIELESIVPQNKLIPCWSFSALLELMPNIRTKYGVIRCKLDKDETSKFPYMFYYSLTYSTMHYSVAIDAAFEMMCWLLENDKIL